MMIMLFSDSLSFGCSLFCGICSMKIAFLITLSVVSFLALDQALVKANYNNGIYPIGTEAVYVGGDYCTVNLTKGSNTDYCQIETPLSVASQDLIPKVNKCVEGRTDLPSYVMPSFNKCLSLHSKIRHNNQ